MAGRERHTRRRRLTRRLAASRRCPVCGKRRYATLESAKLAMAKPGVSVRGAYLEHGWWHLTSKKGMKL